LLNIDPTKLLTDCCFFFVCIWVLNQF